jgi:hypothetical protein
LFKISIQGVSLLHFHVCMYVVEFSSSPLFFFFVTSSFSYGGFNRYKNSVLILVKRIHQPHSPS